MRFYPDSFKVSTPADRSIHVERDFNAPRELVFDAFTRPELVRRWLLGPDGWTMPVCEIDLRVGGAYIVRTSDGALHISGEVAECVPCRKLSFTFNVNWPELIDKLGPTLVTYEIEPAGEAVRLTMTESHDRPLDDDILSGGRQGWPAILSSLKSLLETGLPLVVKMAPPERKIGRASCREEC